jgi:hypothetical protein
MKTRYIRTPLALAAATTLAFGLSTATANASLVYQGCGSSNYIRVMYSPGGNVKYECFAGLGVLNTNVPNVDWVTAGAYWTYALVKYPSGYSSDCMPPHGFYNVGNATLVQLYTTTTAYC